MLDKHSLTFEQALEIIETLDKNSSMFGFMPPYVAGIYMSAEIRKAEHPGYYWCTVATRNIIHEMIIPITKDCMPIFFRLSSFKPSLAEWSISDVIIYGTGKPKRPVKLMRSIEPEYKTDKIYFIQAGDNGPIKIGVTNNVRKRLSILQTFSPQKLKLLAIIEGSYDKERLIHQIFSKLRVRGEWFKPEPDLLEYINRLSGGFCNDTT